MHYRQVCNSQCLRCSRIVAENIVELSYGRLKDEQGRDYVKLNAHLLEVVDTVMAGYVVDLIPARKRIVSCSRSPRVPLASSFPNHQ